MSTLLEQRDQLLSKLAPEERERKERELEQADLRVSKMMTRLKGYFKGANMPYSMEAIGYMREMHSEQLRRSGELYIIHPLSMACRAQALDVRDDNLMATIILHDVVEDTAATLDTLPVNKKIRRSVKYMTIKEYPGEKKSETKNRYYHQLLEDRHALICKGFDRRDNLSTMKSLPPRAIRKNILETHLMLLPTLDIAKGMWSPYADLLYLLRSDIRDLNNILAHYNSVVDLDDMPELLRLLDDPSYRADA